MILQLAHEGCAYQNHWIRLKWYPNFDFWIDNRNSDTISDRLGHQLEMWRTRPTNRMDMRQIPPTFGQSSYHQILFGLDHVPDLTGEDFIYPYKDLADSHSSHIANQVARDSDTLPGHRNLINSIYASAANV